MTAAKTLLSSVPGVAVIDRLPLDGMNRDCARALFWIIGHFVGRQVAQKWDGSMLYDVHDSGKSYSYGLRGSYTSVELVFHTDNAFAVAQPDWVGLMCFHPAREGGVSRFCSLLTLHDRMLEHYPDALERGQLQFLNNVSTAHYRSEFVDFEDAEMKRHLLRTWHRDWGRISYDG